MSHLINFGRRCRKRLMSKIIEYLDKDNTKCDTCKHFRRSRGLAEDYSHHSLLQITDDPWSFYYRVCDAMLHLQESSPYQKRVGIPTWEMLKLGGHCENRKLYKVVRKDIEFWQAMQKK